MFADDVKVSKGMVKYACGIPKESIVDVGGILTCPEAKIESATQKDVSFDSTELTCCCCFAGVRVAGDCSTGVRAGSIRNAVAGLQCPARILPAVCCVYSPRSALLCFLASWTI
jgi:hypothetical protein